MAALAILRFSTADGAQKLADLLRDLQMQQSLAIPDAAIVSWPAGAQTPRTQQLTGSTGTSALDGAFWGMLFGLIFFVPQFGPPNDTATDELASYFADFGIDDDFIRDARGKLTERTSALFLLSDGTIFNRLADEVRERVLEFEVMASALSAEQESRLRRAFAI